jgi:hypothetical protein
MLDFIIQYVSVAVFSMTMIGFILYIVLSIITNELE